jgi:enoyl-CoA hydratase/carnithine racemase
MSFVSIKESDNIAIVKMSRDKVNAINSDAVDDLIECFKRLENKKHIKAIIITGNEKFFSFGFDVPELLTYSKQTLKNFLTRFTQLNRDLFLYPRPLIGALNGHTIAAGCMLALATDVRIMVSDNARISLNEINIGVPVFAGALEMLKFSVGQRNAEHVLKSGNMYSPDEALQLCMIDKLSNPEMLMNEAMTVASEYAEKNPLAFRSLKGLLRKPIMQVSDQREESVIDEFIDIWFSEQSQAQLKTVQIRS